MKKEELQELENLNLKAENEDLTNEEFKRLNELGNKLMDDYENVGFNA